MTFARTKLQLPRARTTFVERGALGTELAAALASRRVVLLCAPAGYGKTMLLAHEIARRPAEEAVAWVSVDAGDDLQRLAECMLAALEPYDPPWRTAPEALVAQLGQASADEERRVAAEIINTLDACEVPHGTIVFDDVHRVDDRAFFRFLDRVIERMTPRWTIALTSRTDPPLSLARLRATDELAEFRQSHLQFARDEARGLVVAAGLDPAIADRVFDRTQGWPAGVRLAVGALRTGVRGDDAGSAVERALKAGDRPIFEFLIAEVLEGLRPELADFLLRVAVLPELQATRCAEVSQNENAAALLDEVERLGLFVDTVDAPVRTLRLHDLLREAMQAHLAHRDPALLDALRRRAAATEPDPMRRAGLLLATGAIEEAARLVLAHAPSVVATAGPAGPEHLMAQFPPAFRERSPELAFARGLISWFRWDFAGMMASMARAASGFAAAGDTAGALFARAYRTKALISLGHREEAVAELAAIGSFALPADTRIIVLSALIWLAIDTGKLNGVAPLIDEMVSLLEQVDRIDLWYHTTPPHRLPGLPGVAPPLARHAALLLRVAGDEPTPLRALALFSQAWCAVWQGRLADARVLVERARDAAEWSGNPLVLRGHFLALNAVLGALAGDAVAAMSAARARNRALASPSAWTNYVLLLFAARIASTCSDIGGLEELLPQLDALKTRLRVADLAASTRSQLPVAAQLAWLQGRTAEATALWRESLAHEEEIDFLGQAAQTRFRLARSLVQQGALAEAAALIGPVFARARAERAPGAALFATDALRDLAGVAWGDALQAADQAELRGWWSLVAEEWAQRAAPSGGGRPQDASPRDAAGRGDLTARELEVLRHVCAGDSNKVIARALDLSLHTVKRHVANILGKLDVKTRGQAAAWHRQRQS